MTIASISDVVNSPTDRPPHGSGRTPCPRRPAFRTGGQRSCFDPRRRDIAVRPQADAHTHRILAPKRILKVAGSTGLRSTLRVEPNALAVGDDRRCAIASTDPKSPVTCIRTVRRRPLRSLMRDRVGRVERVGYRLREMPDMARRALS
jgi:hypothetical protein